MNDERIHSAEFEDRREYLIDFFADRGPGGYLDRVEFIEVAARLYRERDVETALEWLDNLLEDPHGDMFWMYPMALTALVGQKTLPADVQSRMREQWKTYTPYRGDTENHWLIYYSTLFLMSEFYPDEPGREWFNGRSSVENRQEAADYIHQWIDLTVREGQGEFDSPHYLCFFIPPLALLFGFAKDQRLRQRAGMMLDYLVADFATDQLNGEFAGAFSRIYPEPTLERWRNGSTTYAWLLFGNTTFEPDAINVILPRVGYRPHGTALILAMSGYKPPAILADIATDLSKPVLQTERKRTRHRIRFSEVRNQPVYKTMYRCRDYAVGSIQGGLLQPIQQHTWDVLWATEKPHEGFNTLFTVHPYSSGLELGMYFPEEPRLLTKSVIAGEKGTYDSPDKWTGGSPFEQVFQYEDTVIVLYDIPEGTRFPHIGGYFSRKLKDLVEHDSGWIFARAGRAYLAYYPLAPYSWEQETGGDTRLHSAHLKNGAVVQMAREEEFPSLEAFCEAIAALPIETRREPTPWVAFSSLRGAELIAEYGNLPHINGDPVRYEKRDLFDGDLLESPNGSAELTVKHGAQRYVLNFNEDFRGYV